MYTFICISLNYNRSVRLQNTYIQKMVDRANVTKYVERCSEILHNKVTHTQTHTH